DDAPARLSLGLGAALQGVCTGHYTFRCTDACIHIDQVTPFDYTAVYCQYHMAREAVMETKITEIADGVFRLSTFIAEVPPTGLSFNQFLIRSDEPLLFHTGMRGLFPLVR